MVDLDEETIDMIKKVKDVLKETSFDINHFEVGDTGAEGTMVLIDIRRHSKEVEDCSETECPHYCVEYRNNCAKHSEGCIKDDTSLSKGVKSK